MRTQLQVRSSLADKAVHELLGKRAAYEHIPIISANGDVSVFKPNGERLLTVCREAISKEAIDAAFPFMWELRKQSTTNRGAYAGDSDVKLGSRQEIKHGVRRSVVKLDGTISKTNYAAPVRSSVVGYFDRNPRFPYCRETAYVTANPVLWGQALPFIQQIGRLFRDTIPDRYAAQLEMAQKTHPAYVIPETPFTTVTVNNTVAGAYHTDKGDYEPGFGCMAVFRRGVYRGGQTVFPKYGVGADLQHGDVIFFDPHEVHGVIPFHDSVGWEAEDWVRISMVFYFRAKMVDCLEPTAELERAKQLRGGIS